jgi:hypothetical protein
MDSLRYGSIEVIYGRAQIAGFDLPNGYTNPSRIIGLRRDCAVDRARTLADWPGLYVTLASRPAAQAADQRAGSRCAER